ncbi:MAG: hypothetical protein JSS75_13490 [Bacteroidetes bacterium]|nr:hypothetical protein [Bacteroidota bacterium]
MKRLRRVISAVLVTCIMISSIGYTAVSFACPKMSTKQTQQCSMCNKSEKASTKTKDCCKPIVEHKVVHTDSLRSQDSQSVQVIAAVLPQPMIVVSNDLDLFGTVEPIPGQRTVPLPPDASTARAMLSTFVI